MPAPLPDYVYLIGDIDGDNTIDQADLDALVGVPGGGMLPAGMPLYQATLGPVFTADDLTYLTAVKDETADPVFVAWLHNVTPPMIAPDNLFIDDSGDVAFVVHADVPCLLGIRLKGAMGVATEVSLNTCGIFPGQPLVGISPIDVRTTFGSPYGIGYFTPNESEDVTVQFQLDSGFYIVKVKGFDPRGGKLLWENLAEVDQATGFVADLQEGEFIHRVVPSNSTNIVFPPSLGDPADYQIAISPLYEACNDTTSLGAGAPLVGDLILAADGNVGLPRGDSLSSAPMPYVQPFQIFGILPATGSQEGAPIIPSGTERTFLIPELQDPLVRRARFFKDFEILPNVTLYCETEHEEFTEMSRVKAYLTAPLAAWNIWANREDKFTVVVYRNSYSKLLAYLDLTDLATAEKRVFINSAVLEGVPDDSVAGTLMPVFIAASYLWPWFARQTAATPTIPLSFFKALAMVLSKGLNYGTASYDQELSFGNTALFYPWLCKFSDDVGNLAIRFESYYGFLQSVFGQLPAGPLTPSVIKAQVDVSQDVPFLATQIQSVATFWGYPLPPPPIDATLDILRQYVKDGIDVLYPQFVIDANSKVTDITSSITKSGASLVFSPFCEGVNPTSLQGLYLSALLLRQIAELHGYTRLLLAWNETNAIAAFQSMIGDKTVPTFSGIHEQLMADEPLSGMPRFVAGFLTTYEVYLERLVMAATVFPSTILTAIMAWPSPTELADTPSAIRDVTSTIATISQLTQPIDTPAQSVLALAGSVWLSNVQTTIGNGVSVTFSTNKAALISIYRKA